MINFIEFCRLLDLGGRVKLIDFLKFFRLFDVSTKGEGLKVNFFEFFDFSTFRPRGECLNG